MSHWLWITAVAFLVVATIVVLVVLTNRRNKRRIAADAVEERLGHKLTGDPGVYVLVDTVRLVEMPEGDIRGLVVESNVDDTVAYLATQEDGFLRVSHTEEWTADKSTRVTADGTVYAVDHDSVVVHGKRQKGRTVMAAGYLNASTPWSIIDKKCTLGGTLRANANTLNVSKTYVSYCTQNRAYVDQVSSTGLIPRGTLKSPGVESFQFTVCSSDGLHLLVASVEAVMSYSRASVDADFERTGVSAHLGSVHSLKANDDLSVVALQSSIRANGSTVLIYAWDTSKNRLGDVPRMLHPSKGQTLQQVRDDRVYVKTVNPLQSQSVIEVYGPLRELSNS